VEYWEPPRRSEWSKLVSVRNLPSVVFTRLLDVTYLSSRKQNFYRRLSPSPFQILFYPDPTDKIYRFWHAVTRKFGTHHIVSSRTDNLFEQRGVPVRRPCPVGAWNKPPTIIKVFQITGVRPSAGERQIRMTASYEFEGTPVLPYFASRSLRKAIIFLNW